MGKRKILIIEDEKELLTVLVARLEGAGYEAIAAEDGKIGLSKLKKENPDLVILDLVLPRLSGADVLRKIKQDKKTAGMPVVILTAQFITSELEKEIKSDELVDLLQKPYEPENLIKHIAQFFK